MATEIHMCFCRIKFFVLSCLVLQEKATGFELLIWNVISAGELLPVLHE